MWNSDHIYGLDGIHSQRDPFGVGDWNKKNYRLDKLFDIIHSLQERGLGWEAAEETIKLAIDAVGVCGEGRFL